MMCRYILRIVLILTIVIPLQLIHSQRERDVWYFGVKAGMRYNVNSENYTPLSDNVIERPIVFGVIEGADNMICANDENGQLMFYSEGRVFKNRLHQTMLNSPAIEYATYYSQAAVTRDPGDPNRYYVFVIIQDGLVDRLTYTVVDMSLDEGLGGLVPEQTNVVMTSNVGQQLVTARHANGRDRWVICVKRGRYNAYLVTENGISSTPVSSTEGISFFDGNAANIGMMQMSPDNTLLAAGFPVLRKLFILDFDNLTGRLDLRYEEEEEDWSEELGPYTSVEFSANSKVLYTTYNSVGIKQYDLSDLDNIPPRIDIFSLLPEQVSTFPYLKRGPDGKIFSIESGRPLISAIENPNVIGPECNYIENFLFLTGPNLVDLPTFLLPKYPDGISFINICEGETTELSYITTLRDPLHLWNLGDGTTATGETVEHIYDEPGTYTVSVEVFDNESGTLVFSDSREITIYASPTLSQPEDRFLCSEDTNIFFADYNESILNGLDPEIFDVSYYFSERDALLQDNVVQEYIPELGTKTIWVRVHNTTSPSCFDVTSFDIVTPEFITIDIPTEYFICDERLGVTITAPDGFMSYDWSTGETTQSITVTTRGFYTLRVVQDFGEFTCEAQITVNVGFGDPTPAIEDIRVIDWSQNHNSIEVILAEQGDYEYSIDGITYQDSPIFLNLPLQDYRVFVRDARCLREVVSDELFLLYYNKFFTPNNDGVNDYWQVINSIREEDIEISIFDRYGKLMAVLEHFDKGWDGTFNGIEMPTADYWFRVVRQNGKIHYGHFTLKR